MRTRPWKYLLAGSALLLALPGVASAAPPTARSGAVEVLVQGLDGALGSTIGPDGALYVTEATGPAGRITRIDPSSGETTTVADCLPPRILPVGGVMDVAFIGSTPYALVTLVDAAAPVNGTSVTGIYRIDGPHTCTVVADIGTWALANPPEADIFLPTGVQYAFEPYGDGFVVTDGHHNRVLRVGLDGQVRELVQLADVVPTGLAIVGCTLYLAEAGPVPHLPQDGRIVSFDLRSPAAPGTVVASGAPLMVDVEPGAGHRLFGLAQGRFTPGQDPGSPADPGTGQLVEVDRHGALAVVAEGLDRPTSLEIVHGTAYVVTLGGEVLRIHGLDSGRRHDG
jgi:hypothetical protein